MNTAPAASNLSVTGHPLEARISWAAAPGATRYLLRRAFAGTTSWSTIVDQSTTPPSPVLDALPDHKRTYTYELLAYQANGNYGSVSANYTPPAPADPAGFTATVIGPGEVKFDWNNVLDQHFRLDGPGAGGTGVWVVGGSSDPSARFTYTLKGIPTGTHTWTVASVYHPGGVLTASSAWPRAMATITTADPAQRYRLTALGVQALQPTADNVFAVDGMGDEVYVAATIHSTTRSFAGVNVSTARSSTYGDVGTSNAFPGRIQGGTYGATGGIRAGDVVPISLNLANPTGTPNMLGFPLLLWEGVLDDNAMVVIEPTVWEQDSDNKPYGSWLNLGSSTAIGAISNSSIIVALRDQGQVGPAIDPTIEQRIPGMALRGNLYISTDDGIDRPIGVDDYTSRTPYVPYRILVLTKLAVENLLNGPGQRAGSAPGVIVVPITDSVPGFTAFYELYLRVERVP